MWLPNRVVLSFILSLFIISISQAQAHGHHSNEEATLLTVAVVELPLEARDVIRLIKQGGPYPYPRDGIVFSNRERRLPKQSRGYYHEFTVKTPGARNRGARRVVCGVVPECYYADDHYQSFKRIKE